MRHGFLKPIVIGGFAVAAGAAALWYFQKSATLSAPNEAPPPTLEDIARTIRVQNESMLNSEESRVFREGDTKKAQDIIKAPKNDADREKLFEAGIHTVSRGATSLNETQLNELYKYTVDYLVENKGNYLGKNARGMTLAMRLLRQFPQPKAGSENATKTLSLIATGVPRGLYQLGLDVVVTWKPLPEAAAQAIRRDMASRDPNVVYSSIQMTQTVIDGKGRVSLVQHLEQNYARLPETTQPLALKILAANSQLIKTDVKKLVRAAAKKDGEPWIDGTLSAIETLDPTEFRTEIAELREKTNNPIVLERIRLLDSRLQGVGQ